ncbi:MAG: hypothetical protein FJ087_06895 [Deltaproteobacteria bacterium]|nr:hypothetical protein [Deltaproteobacteria bacterium]
MSERTTSKGFLPRHRRGLLIGAVAAAGLWGVAIAASYGLSRGTEFCGTCHYEEPFVEEWRASAHASVSCAKCHDGEGFFGTIGRQNRNIWNTLKYWTGLYDHVPRAEVHDGSCLQGGCHEGRTLSGPVKFEKTVDFDHKGHLEGASRGVDMPCVACHSRIVQGEHMTVTKDSCFLCHFKDLPQGVAVAGCKCHGTPDAPVEHKGFSLTHAKFVGLGIKCSDCHLDVTVGDGSVPPARCSQCHLRRDVEKHDRDGIHGNHVTEHDIACDRCHTAIEHRQVKMVRTLEVSCATCHTATHDPHRDMYMGVGAKGVEPYPDMMFKAQVGCDGCHKEKRTGGAVAGETAAFGTRAACVSCHGAGYDAMLDNWQALLRDAMNAIRAKREAVKDLPAGIVDPVARAAAQGRLEQADFNLRFLGEGRPEHNVLYAERVLAQVQADLDAVAVAARPDAPPADVLPFPKEAVTAKCTGSCHSNMDKVGHVEHDGLDLSHRDHIFKHELPCMYCHDNSKKHGAVRLQRQQCIHCHHVQQSAECGTACHRKQAAFIRGDGVPDLPASPDVMAGQVGCADCHKGIDQGHDPERIKAACVECHDEKYGAMQAQWQADTMTLLSASAAAIAAADADRAKPMKALIKAKGAVSVVQEDRSKGAHNPAFAKKVLDAALNALAKPASGATPAPTPTPTPAPGPGQGGNP